ncbi:hypothetical protein TI39_contig51g00012 [Zymoseptoria brevis]|uniref:Uncharacterized protein n=1 Tax=Zymoseptoria brevis TaxID=1047168 RepID=A0A0F4GZK3_9PEZI|nr:hypothetical protein TI39_contig51g00012 [Zymoseptoria brevis]
MRFPLLITGLLSALTSAKVLVSYSAAKHDQTSSLGLLNLDGWGRKRPASRRLRFVSFLQGTPPPPSTPSAIQPPTSHDQPVKDKTYYIAYVVRFETAARGMIVFQWKDYAEKFIANDNIPARLVFRSNNKGVGVKTNPYNAEKGVEAWTQKMKLGKTYRFGIVVNTSQRNGYFEMYVDGHDVTGRIQGNYLPGGTKGAASPKMGLYGAEEGLQGSDVYEVVVGTRMEDVSEVAGIPVGW